MASPVWLTLLTFLLSAAAFQIFPMDSVIGYPTACASVLSWNITACSNLVASFDPNTVYDQGTLESSCTDACRSTLAMWYTQASNGCNNITFVDDYGAVMSIASMIGSLGFNFNQTCLTYNSQYCGVVLGNLTNTNSTSNSSDCNYCSLLRLRSSAQSPYGDGPLVYSEGLYQSYTSSCGYTGYPLSVYAPSATFASTGTSVAASNPAQATPAACGSPTYVIRPGDTCDSIATSQGTATWWLLLDNNLPAYCNDFPLNGTLCIAHSCKPYKVKPGDTCDSVATTNNITVTQLRTYNPWIAVGCYNFNRTIGSQLCLDEPGQKYVPPSTTIGSPSIASSAVPLPTNVANNTTGNCGQYYPVQAGDTCDLVVLKYGIDLPTFVILNPEVNANCTNLLAGESYCVEAVGSINNYPASPFYHANTSNASTIAFTSFPNSTYTPLVLPNTLPLAPGTIPGCYTYTDGESLSYGYPGASDCNVATYNWGFTLAELGSWNPSLAVNSSNCTFSPYFQYCVWKSQPTAGIIYPNATSAPPSANISTMSTDNTTGASPSSVATTLTSMSEPVSGPTTTTTGVSAPPSPTQSGSIAPDCNQYAKAVSGDACDSFAQEHGITTAELYQWNAVLGSNGQDCSPNFYANYYYCVGVASNNNSSVSSTTSTSHGPSVTPASTPMPVTASSITSASVPTPTQSGSIATDCNNYAESRAGDTCDSFAQEHDISSADLYAWNTVLGTDGKSCDTQFFANYYYCIGVSSAPSSSASTGTPSITATVSASMPSSSVSPSTSASSAASAAPSPTQTGSIATNCNNYAKSASGDTCDSFAKDHAISTADLCAWNTVLGSDGAACSTMFFANYYYCISVSA